MTSGSYLELVFDFTPLIASGDANNARRNGGLNLELTRNVLRDDSHS